MKYIKLFETDFVEINKEVERLPIENSKFKVGDEVIFIGHNYTNPYNVDSNRCEIGEKYKIKEIISTAFRYYYKVWDENNNQIGYIIPEKRFLYDWEYKANQYNL